MIDSLTHLSPLIIAVLAFVCVTVGVLIGSIGIGGILMVPVLHYLGGIEIHTVIASCMFSYGFSGLVGALAHARKGSMDWSKAIWLCIGAMPGALLGALLAMRTSSSLLVLIVGLFVGFAAISVLRQKPAAASTYPSSRPITLAAGAVTGVGSAMSGSGGPLVLVPLLVWLRWPVLLAVGLAQIIQIPVSVLASTANLYFGKVDIALGLAISVAIASGTWLGAGLAHHLPATLLRRCVLTALLLVAAWMLLNAGHTLLTASV